jgi:hypothetical protein
MMHRLPYELVAIEVDRLMFRMMLAAPWEMQHYWDLCALYIEACGWTEREFDREMLRRIDAAWESFRRQLWN